jgi:Carboxypeptidase regulatory-like domain/TonB dependent receptor
MKLGLTRLVAISLLGISICCLRCVAQTGGATVTGEITDAQGKLVPRVTVVFTNVNTGAASSTVTNNEGIYVLAALQPGIYRANLTKQGFKSVVKPDIELHTQDQVSLNFSLELGSITETVTVSANAEHMPSDSPAAGLLVDRTFVENLPLNGRSFQDLISLAPGTVSAASGTGLFSVDGQREDSNYYELDGVSSNLNSVSPAGQFLPGPQSDLRELSGVFPSQTALGTTQSLISVDALQEFKIQTSGYSAEYGRQPGGQVELTSRSGTNDTHGSLFDYFRNTVLDANSYFNKFYEFGRSPEQQNDFGGTVGGALHLPKLYNGKDKTFYFVSYEGLRLKQPVSAFESIEPTVAFRQFAAPTIQPFLNAFPVPTGTPNGDQCAQSLGYTFSCTALLAQDPPSFPSSIDSFSFRVDQIISSRVQLFARYANTQSSVAETGAQASSVVNNTQTFTFGSTMRLTANLVDELRINYSTNNGVVTDHPVAYLGSVPYPRTLLIPAQYAPSGTFATGIFAFDFLFFGSGIQLDNFGNVPEYGESGDRQRQFNLIDSIAWNHGSHAAKFGVDYRRLSPVYNPGPYAVSYFPTSISDIQQGAAEAFPTAYQLAYPTFNNLSLYAEDHWKVTSRLTFDYGLRWEFNPAPGASNGIYPLAASSSNPLTATIAPEGTPQYSTRYDDFAPRLGFAYNVIASHNHPLVVRGGFGIFYDTGQALGAQGYGSYPFFATNSIPDSPLPLPVSQLAPPVLETYPSGPPPYGGCCGVQGMSDPHLRLPYTEQWNVTLDEGLAARNTLSLSYLGNVGRRLLLTETTRDNPNFNEFGWISNGAFSNYNALQVQDQGFVAPGMQVVASYTWAHAMDDDSVDSSQPSSSFIDQPWRGNSDNDIRQSFNLAVNYSIPGHEEGRFLRGLTSGWSLSNRFTAQTGYPVTVYQGTYCDEFNDCANVQPDRVAGVPLYLSNVPGVPFGWQINPAAFVPVPLNPDGSPAEPGNVGRNQERGPGFWSLNTAIQRSFPIHESVALNFRLEAFNIFNHPNGGSPATCLCVGPQLFGTLSNTATLGAANALYAMGAPRSLQLMLRLQF